MLSELPRVAPGPSIYAFIRARLDQAGRLEDPEMRLPDEEAEETGRVTWAAGALDGAYGHHFGHDDSEVGGKAAVVVDACVLACAEPSETNLTKLYEELSTDPVLDYIDPVIGGLAERRPDPEALQRLGLWLATTASDRSAVKAGLALLGLTGIGEHLEVVRALGAHEEFTLFSAGALMNGHPEPESELWALACVVHGWGRIHCVERLRNTQDPAIRSWLLREGFRNTIMHEYLAHIAATTGGLLEALRGDDVDRPLLTAAGEILQALLNGGPAEDIEDYDSGADAVEAYLGHLTTRAETLVDFHTLMAIRTFLTESQEWDERSRHGWTTTRREAFTARCTAILDRPEWRDRVAVGLLSDDRTEFWQADRAARLLGIDTFDVHLQKLREQPFDNGWFDAWQQADTERAQHLVALARRLLPLDEIATGPADELGLGPKWRPHLALDWTLQALPAYPGTGGDLVMAGLRSPVTRNRRLALHVLQHWPRSTWPSDARAQVEALADGDPDEHGRKLSRELLQD